MLRFEHHLTSVDNFESWKLRIMMLLKENKLDSFVKEEKEEPKDDLEKTLCIENNEKAMKIIVDAVRDHSLLWQNMQHHIACLKLLKMHS